jgi:hypothetical protein
MNLRNIVKQHLEEQALRNYLKSRYDQTPPREKKKFLEQVDSRIEAEVELILRSFVDDIQKGSPDKKRRRNIAIFNLVMTAILTPGIGYAVNIENWTFVWVLSVVLAAVQIFNVIAE